MLVVLLFLSVLPSPVPPTIALHSAAPRDMMARGWAEPTPVVSPSYSPASKPSDWISSASAPTIGAPSGPSPANDSDGLWTNETPYVGPPPPARYAPYLISDPANQRILLTGGVAVAPPQPLLTDRWEFVGGGWYNVTPPSAPRLPSTIGVFAEDPSDGTGLLFGGYTASTPSDTNFTWLYSNGTWTNITAQVGVAPPPSDSGLAYMVYDAAEQEYVLLSIPAVYNGSALFYQGAPLTWVFSNDAWTNITLSAGTPPVGSLGGAMAYDAADDSVVEFGGFNASGAAENFSNSTWIFADGTWSSDGGGPGSPPSRYDAALAYDPVLGGLVLYSGYRQGPGASSALGDTWLWATSGWQNLTSEIGGSDGDPLPGGSLVYYAAGGYLLYVGDGSAGRNFTWVLGTPGPFVRLTLQPATVEANESYRIAIASSFPSSELTYHYPSLPPGCLSRNESELSCQASESGSYPIVAYVSTADGTLSRSVWANLTVISAVAIVAFSAPQQAYVGSTARFELNVTGGFPPYGVDYSGLPVGCQPGDLTEFACELGEVGGFVATASVTDNAGVRVAANATVSVVYALTGASVSVSPSLVDLGGSIQLNLTLDGGAPPFSVQYAGLPPGCPVSSGAIETCVPMQSGHFTVSADVRDNLGTNLETPVFWLVVNPSPEVTSFTISPDSVLAGDLYLVAVNISGGTGPFSVRWGGLPADCLASGKAFSCRSNLVGTYNVTVNVVDALGVNATAWASLMVVAPAANGGVSPLLVSTLAASIGFTVAGVAFLVYRWHRRRKRDPLATPIGPIE